MFQSVLLELLLTMVSIQPPTLTEADNTTNESHHHHLHHHHHNHDNFINTTLLESDDILTSKVCENATSEKAQDLAHIIMTNYSRWIFKLYSFLKVQHFAPKKSRLPGKLICE